MVNIKVNKGTPKHGVSLCQTCRSGMMVEGPGRKIIYCGCLRGIEGGPAIMTCPIYSCTGYDDKSKPSRWSMEQIAWNFCTDEKKEFTGFKPPKKSNSD